MNSGRDTFDGGFVAVSGAFVLQLTEIDVTFIAGKIRLVKRTTVDKNPFLVLVLGACYYGWGGGNESNQGRL